MLKGRMLASFDVLCDSCDISIIVRHVLCSALFAGFELALSSIYLTSLLNSAVLLLPSYPKPRSSIELRGIVQVKPERMASFAANRAVVFFHFSVSSDRE